MGERMKIDIYSSGDYETLLIRWMNQYGDDILKTCYLLCGDLIEARQIARKVFIHAYDDMHEYLSKNTLPAFCFLLSISMKICPCRLRPERIFWRCNTVSYFLFLPPLERRAAILCLYHNLNTVLASQILRIPEERIGQILSSAKKHIRI